MTRFDSEGLLPGLQPKDFVTKTRRDFDELVVTDKNRDFGEKSRYYEAAL